MAMSLIVTAAAASIILATVGAKKVYASLTANRGLTLPSLRSVAPEKCAYPEDLYPGELGPCRGTLTCRGAITT